MGAFLSSCLSDRNEVQDAPLENDNLSVERSNEALVKQRQCLEVIKKQQAAFLLRLQQKALLPNSDVEVVPPEMNLVSVCQTEEVSNREGSEQVMICSFCREPAKAKDPLSLVSFISKAGTRTVLNVYLRSYMWTMLTFYVEALYRAAKPTPRTLPSLQRAAM